MMLSDIASSGAKISKIPANEWEDFIIPLVENLDEGNYDSVILHIDASALEDDNSKSQWLDVYQRLTSNDGNHVVVRFRLYAGKDISAWAKIFTENGFSGELTELIGVREDIKIKHGRTYAYIAERHLISSGKDEDTGEINKEPRAKNNLMGRRNSPSAYKLSKKELLDDDGMFDDDFEDFLDESDEE